MIQWDDEGLVLKSLPFGEHALRIIIFTKEHGLVQGIEKWGRRKKINLPHQRGNLLKVRWQARLSEHMGTWHAELWESNASFALSFTKEKLQAFETLLGLCALTLPPHAPFPQLYAETLALLRLLKKLPTPEINVESMNEWLVTYCRWEYKLIEMLGYGFNLRAGNEVILLEHGIGINKKKAEQHGQLFLPLPAFLYQPLAPKSLEEIEQAMSLTGYFLRKILLEHKIQDLPKSREKIFNPNFK